MVLLGAVIVYIRYHNISYPTYFRQIPRIPKNTGAPHRRTNTCSLEGEHSLPSNFPDDIPIYSDTTPSEATCVDTASYEIRFETKDDIQPVLSFYMQQLDKLKWTNIKMVDNSYDIADSGRHVYATRIIAQKYDPTTQSNRQVSILIRNLHDAQNPDSINDFTITEHY